MCYKVCKIKHLRRYAFLMSKNTNLFYWKKSANFALENN
jgi:hypothetical protein